MEKILDGLRKCVLFKGIDINKILENQNNFLYIEKRYQKDEIIAFEDDECSSLGIIIEGIIEIKKISASGKSYLITTLHEGDIFGEALIFSNNNRYPATIFAATNCSIVFISKESIIKLCKTDSKFIENFANQLSNRILMLNKKIKELSLDTLRIKLLDLIYKEYEKTNSLSIKLNTSKKILAEKLGVQRPSLSRELINLKKEGIIDFDKDIIVIKDIEAIEDELFNI
ncbi:Crp/Fnr family transcriptional regulator [Caldicellulosiruptoraceae bacterium PP1]